MHGQTIDAFLDELEKIAKCKQSGGGIAKALSTNLTAGVGPLHKRLIRNLKSAGSTVKNQVKRYGVVDGLL